VLCGSVQVWLGWEERALQRQNEAIKLYGLALVEGLPRESVVLTKGDLTIYPTRYVQACLGVREDVVVMDQEVMGYDWYIPRVRRHHSGIRFPPGVRLRPVGKPGRCVRSAPAGMSGPHATQGGGSCAEYDGVFNLQQLFASNHGKVSGGQFFIVDPKSGDHSFEASFRLEPHGMLQRVVARTAPAPPNARRFGEQLRRPLAEHATRLLEASRPFKDQESWEVLVHAEAAEGYHRRALHLLQLASADQDGGGGSGTMREYLKDAVWAFEELLLDGQDMEAGSRRRRIMRTRTWQACKNAGVAAERAWRLAVDDADKQSARHARAMLLFFSCYLEADRNAEDAQLQHARQHVMQLRDLVKQFEPSLDLNVVPSPAASSLPPSPPPTASPPPSPPPPPPPPPPPVKEDAGRGLKRNSGGAGRTIDGGGGGGGGGGRGGGMTEETSARIALLCRRQWGRDTEEMQVCIRRLSATASAHAS